MKKTIVALGLLVFTMSAVTAQKITWTYTAKKLTGDKYELHITAQPPVGWHVYSQTTPDGGPVPTSFTFNKNALLTLSGKVNEKGKLVTYYDKNFKVNVKYFEGKVEFVQTVAVKGKINDLQRQNLHATNNRKICYRTSIKFNGTKVCY